MDNDGYPIVNRIPDPAAWVSKDSVRAVGSVLVWDHAPEALWIDMGDERCLVRDPLSGEVVAFRSKI